MSAFHDHFSRDASGYARSRPTYPEAMFRRLAELAPARAAAWDCATGSGQAAIGLARHFTRVEATDASAQQIANALPAPNVRYSVQPAESTDFPAASFDALCVAQALHWFDVDRFYAEVRRVVRPGGPVLVTGYGWSNVSPRFDEALDKAVIQPIEPLWAPQNTVLLNAYRDVPFPFERVAFPQMQIEVRWSLGQMMDYVATWSATRRMLDQDPGFLERNAAALQQAWGAEASRTVTMPLHVLCGRRA